MNEIQRNERGEILLPEFPELRKALNIADKECEMINGQVLPAIRREGFEVGLSTNFIMQAATFSNVLPSVPKLSLVYGRFMKYTGRAMTFDREAFFKEYNETDEGRQRQESLRRLESLKPSDRAKVIIDR